MSSHCQLHYLYVKFFNAKNTHPCPWQGLNYVEKRKRAAELAFLAEASIHYFLITIFIIITASLHGKGSHGFSSTSFYSNASS
jgi:hypothetical protein